MENIKDVVKLSATDLPQQLSEVQKAFLEKRTPAVFIKSRPIRGGGNANYVEVGYVIEMLNAIFGMGAWDWEYEIVVALSFPNTKQIVLTGKLTCRIHDKSSGEVIATIIKTASGGGEIKTPKGGTEPIDLADDVKSASADALKKAASLIGIAADVYYPSVYMTKQKLKAKNAQPVLSEAGGFTEHEIEEVEAIDDKDQRIALQRQIFALGKELAVKGKLILIGLSDMEKKEHIKKWLNSQNVQLHSFSQDPIEVLNSAIMAMQDALQ